MDRNATCLAIQAASTEAEVITALRKYLSALDSGKAGLLPATLLAVGVNHAQEIAQAAVELASREMTSDGPTAVLLRDAATVLSTAAMRLAVLSSGAHA
jgi:hypothetical protein